jgi:phosphoribosylamine--glycine ligase
MKVLVVGKGGREHSLCWRLNQSPTVWGLYCTGGSPGINQVARPVDVAPEDFTGLARFSASEKIDLTIVGPEAPLANGIVDEFERAGLTIFGPSKAAAQLEASKAFAKLVMREAGVPTADFGIFDDADTARHYVKSINRPCVVKADGLAFGKGVTVCETAEAALVAIAQTMDERCFGSAGARVVIEEMVRGEELSFFAFCDGTDAVALGCAQDHKAVFDGDRGPNTGGMGAFTPVPRFDVEFEARVMHEVVRPTLTAMAARGTPFRGVMFVGLMVEAASLAASNEGRANPRFKVLEYNVRFGDPECEPLMMRFDGDLAETLLAIAQGRAREVAIRLSSRTAASVVLTSGGYPGDYVKGKPIAGLERIDGVEPSEAKVRWAMEKTRVKVFHAGTAHRNGVLVTDGGRVLAVTALAQGLKRAVDTAYEAAKMISFDGMHYRRDVGARALDHPSA